MSNDARFDPKAHMMKIQGRDYLTVAWRLVWFRQEHPDWGILTQPVEINLTPDNNRSPYAIFSATITNAEGKVIATATKMEDLRGFGDFLEKSESGAVGRALAYCGYGTQFAPELEEGERLADSPIGERNGGRQQQRGQQTRPTETARVKALKLADALLAFAEEAERHGWTELILAADGNKPRRASGQKCEPILLSIANQHGIDISDRFASAACWIAAKPHIAALAASYDESGESLEPSEPGASPNGIDTSGLSDPFEGNDATTPPAAPITRERTAGR